MSPTSRRIPPVGRLAGFAALALLAGCGGSGSDNGEAEGPAIPGGGDTEDVRVIDAWSDALRRGKVEEAASFFEVPSRAQNGTGPLVLRSRDDVVDFNRSLPCGARLVRATSKGGTTTATFELTDRPGGGCGPGTGETARASFEIEDGLIVEWNRVTDLPQTQGELV